MGDFLFSAVYLLHIVVVLIPSNVSAIPLSQFYPFGTDTGDRTVGPTDDGSSEIISLKRVFPFYESDHFTIVVSSYLNAYLQYI